MPTTLTAAARRNRTARRIKEELRAAGLHGLRVEIYPSGVVINDGDSLWTARPSALLRGAKRVQKELADIQRRAVCDLHQQYPEICGLDHTGQDRLAELDADQG